jgi:hypothetical protein
MVVGGWVGWVVGCGEFPLFLVGNYEKYGDEVISVIDLSSLPNFLVKNRTNKLVITKMFISWLADTD